MKDAGMTLTPLAPLSVCAIASHAQTAPLVKAANAFIATLSGDQRQRFLFPYYDAHQRIRWPRVR